LGKPRQISFYVIVSFTAEGRQRLPDEEAVQLALDYSTAREALAEATGCSVEARIPTPEEMREWEGS
jgi:hypothetical protein